MVSLILTQFSLPKASSDFFVYSLNSEISPNLIFLNALKRTKRDICFTSTEIVLNAVALRYHQCYVEEVYEFIGELA